MRKVKKIMSAKPTLEGAGVHLQRVFGYYDTPLFDPFLMLDDFRNDDPDKYLPGFPWHPHRGIETITYMLEGSAEHGDSIGNSGVIGRNEVQWMTAGSGIIHQEMPKPDGKGRMYGFQLWANLPASHKMTPPRYRGLTEQEIPTVEGKNASIKIICGEYEGTRGPVTDVVIDPQFWDKKKIPPPPPKRGFFFFFFFLRGRAEIDGHSVVNREVVLFEDGDSITVKADTAGFRMLFLCGKPLHEPISWRGPIVMNTKEEIKQAFQDLDNGSFIKEKL